MWYANGASDDYCIRDFGRQTNPNWDINYAYNGQVDPWQDTGADGIRETDPGLDYNSEWEMYETKNTPFDIKMTHKPLKTGDVGISWWLNAWLMYS